MGGSGSPAPSSTAPALRGAGLLDAAAEPAFGGAAFVAAQPSRLGSGIGGSGRRPRPPRRSGHRSTGCRRRWLRRQTRRNPMAAAGASGRSGLARCTGDCFAAEDGPGRRVPEAGHAPRASAADRSSPSGIRKRRIVALLPGGVLSEFTAYTPTSTLTIAATTASILDRPPRRLNGVRLHPAGCRSSPSAESADTHIRGEYGQRWEPQALDPA